MAALEAVSQVASPDELVLAERLIELGQEHLFAEFAQAEAQAQKRLLAQLLVLEQNYPGGLSVYIESARRLLGQAQRGENPLAGWSPRVPENGYCLEPCSEAYAQYERRGLEEAAGLGFVVPAGGLGERLGFHGVKFALPADMSSETTVLQVYVSYILAVQKLASQQAGRPVLLPLAIMVSDDTAQGIAELLEQTGRFGLQESQVTLLKQEKVAAMRDSEAALAMADGMTVATKPHGHGDVHFLLHSTGTAARWHKQGTRWLMFFQDTSTLYFATFLATLGVSAAHDLAVNLVSVPRKAKEAIGAVALLQHDDGRQMVANVEYNQLEPLLLATGHSEGDVNEADGFSKFPGNINEIMIDLTKYLEALESTGGQVDEFINPKYTDETRTAFKSPTRLECMMQDYAKTVPAGHAVGWTRYPTEFGYFPCKNDIDSGAKLSASGVPPHTASTAEMAVYEMHACTLRRLGGEVAPAVTRSFRGVTVGVGPSIVLEPSFAPCATLLSEKLPSPAMLKISARSTLVVRGMKVVIEELVLDGALVLEVEEGASLRVKSLKVENAGWRFEELSDAEQASEPEILAIRGYRLVKEATRTIRVSAGNDMIVDEAFTGLSSSQRLVHKELPALHTGHTKKSLQSDSGSDSTKNEAVKVNKDPNPGCCALL